MSAKKQSKPSKEPPNKKLSVLETKLLKLSESGQPVLLCGKDNVDRLVLIPETHLSYKVVFDYFGYAGNKKMPDHYYGLMDYSENQMWEAIKAKNYERLHELISEAQSFPLALASRKPHLTRSELLCLSPAC